ncbi:GroES-like protein [Mollisia scopiformis]|uniref:GroES-like protein n=1 Tax=Mollisia scopiformis TaxID=149040 RepID=A0A194XQB1_MOLSC|nr:GroES-like protein [Mollisia scopiformis]KUJ22383.1 GroES-like protein [Mollisia scopiformis]
MSKTQAIVVQKKGDAKVTEVSVPKVRDDYIIVKTKAIALNPTDWKHIDFLCEEGERIGCDYAGIVEEVGSKVTKGFKKGDRVAGFVHGGNMVEHEDGAFANIITAKGDIQIKIPDNISFEEASTLGVGITTVGQGLYQSLKLPLPNKPSSSTEKKYLLIYGGSTATGSLAIQYAKLSGLNVITTSSPRNFDYVKSLGAVAAFDYNSPTCSQEIKDFTKDSVTLAFDCIAEGDSPKITVSAMSTSEGGTYSTLLPVPDEQVTAINDKVKNQHTLAYTVVGESFKFGTNEVPAVPADFEEGSKFWELTRELLADGKIKVHRPSVDKYGKGLEGALKGLEAMKAGQVSGEKLVFTM